MGDLKQIALCRLKRLRIARANRHVRARLQTRSSYSASNTGASARD
jgi:hypothetical protein